MKKKMRMAFSAVAALSTVAVMSYATAWVGNAEEGANAYLFLRSVSEAARFEGIDDPVNTISDGAVTATIDKDGSYTVEIDVTKEKDITIDEISILKVYVNVTEEESAATIKVDSLKFDGEEVALTDDPVCLKAESGTGLYVDLCDTNGAELFDRLEYQEIKTISVDFTVIGWPETENGTTITEEKKEETTTTTTTTAQNITSVPQTGESAGFAIAGVCVLAAAAGMIVSKKKF